MPVSTDQGNVGIKRQIPTGTLAAILLLLTVTFGLQWLTGAYHSEFGAEPDEAAHFMTGLCLRDYLAAGCPGNPVQYVREYYQFYPKVALGHWPPLFNVIQATWMLVLPPSHTSMLVLMGAFTAAIAITLFLSLRRPLGIVPATCAALLFLAMPLTQRASGMVMLEVPITLWSLLATLCWSRYLKSERPGDAAAFGLFAAMALLTKQTGLALVVVPAISIMLTGRWHLLRRLSFWLPAVMVIALCGPWYAFAPKLVNQRWSWDAPLGWGFTGVAIPYYAKKFYAAVGLGVLLFTVVGAAGKLTSRATRTTSPLWAALVGLFVGVWMVHITIPVAYEARYLLPALPVVAAFAVAGAVDVARWLAKRLRWELLSLPLGFAALCLSFGAETFTFPKIGWQGYGAAADWILKNSPAQDSVTMIASDARGEGMFISELAIRESRPVHVVRRASKDLASSTWNGTAYEPKVRNKTDLLAVLRQTHTRFVIFDTSLPPWTRRSHHDLLAQSLSNSTPDEFVLETELPIQRGGVWRTNAIRIYQVSPN